MRLKYSIPIAMLVLVMALTACGPSIQDQGTGPNITINSSGTVYMAPDIAYIYVGVHSENPDIGQAVANNNTQAQKVMDSLRAMGIEAKDIQTSNFSVYSSQQYDKLTGQPSGLTYMVDNIVYVTVRDLAKLPEILDAAVRAGANNINSIQFDIADKDAALKQARKLAVENADALAQELADNTGVKLGTLISVSYTETQSIPVYSYYGKGGGGAEGPSAVVSINPGQMQLTANVSVIYSISK